MNGLYNCQNFKINIYIDRALLQRISIEAHLTGHTFPTLAVVMLIPVWDKIT